MHAEQDPEMARYLDRSYWDQKNKEETSKVPSAPTHLNNSSLSSLPVSSAPVCMPTSNFIHHECFFRSNFCVI